MRCLNCQTLNPANAKFCLECGTRLIVCPNCGTVNPPAAKFCIECGTALQAKEGETRAPSPLPAANQIPATPAPSDVLLPSEERRVVTIMFADIIGSTPLADRLDPEDMRAILTGYFNLMTEQIRKHGGTVEKYIGDAVMAVFGAPITHEDDPDRAIRAALDMQAALARFNEQRLAQDAQATRLQMRIGINTGEVAIPSNQTHQRQDFLITGDAVNVAARLQQVAAPDTILVGERSYLTTKDVFEFRPIAPLQLKGKPEPIAASVVLGLRKPSPAIIQHPRGIEGHQVRLVGRSLELTLMHANYARVRAERHPHLITILGTPGIGKSRLVREFIAREQSKLKSASAVGSLAAPKILQGRCPPYGEGITYWPLLEIVRSLLNAGEDESYEEIQQRFVTFVGETLARAKRNESTEEIAGTIIRSIGRSSNDMQGSEREKPRRDLPLNGYSVGAKQVGTQVPLLRAWRIFLEALAELQPLIIVVDDLQWADEALLDLLEYLTERITDVPILFLCPARPDFFERRRDWGGGRRNFTTIELEALAQEESNELIDTLLNNSDLPPVLRYTIQVRSEGNPFFVEEIVRMLIDQGLLVNKEDPDHDGELWHLKVQPDTVLSEWLTSSEHLDDTLINMHYTLPLPRVPDTIQGVLAARVDLLNPLEKLVLQHAAIIGRTFWLSTLRELAADIGANALSEILDALIERDFIIEAEKQVRSPVKQDHIFIFKHILIRDVVYNNIPRMRRSQEHAHLALWLEEKAGNDKETYSELLAYHYQQALATWSASLSMHNIEISNGHSPKLSSLYLTRPELRRRAITYLTMAGDQALRSYYTIRALQAYNDAYDLLVDSNEVEPDTLIKMNERLGDAYFQRGESDEAWQAYRKALKLATGENAPTLTNAEQLDLYERLAELTTRWFSSFDIEPHIEEVRSYIDAGLRLTEEKPMSSERVAFLTYQAFWYIRQIETASPLQKAALAEQALSSGQEALQLAEQLDNAYALSLTLDALAFIYTQYHKYKDAHAIQHRRQQLESRLTDREELYDLYISLGKIHEQVADYATALTWFGRAWSNAQTMESPYMLLGSMVWRMRAWRQWNRWDNAWEVAHEVLQLVEHYPQAEQAQLWALETLATIAYRRGERDEGDQYVRQYKRILEQRAEQAGIESQTFILTRMHAIHQASEDWERATADYKDKLQTSEPMPSPEVLSTLAELLITTGEPSEIQSSTCERAVAVAEESGARKSLAIALRARGRMHLEQRNWSQAEDDLRQSQRLCEVLDVPWELGNTLYHLGLLYKSRAASAPRQNKRNADLGRARYHFEQAAGFFESLGAIPVIERVQRALMQDTIARV
jgi:class 3 adenylate cyclase/tetratricopeptide (TPR) repeat protein